MFERLELEPIVIAEDCGVKLMGYTGRVYKLKFGDVIFLNDMGVQQTFNMPIKKVQLGVKLQYDMQCMKKIKRRHWWQFWKKKYTGANFMYVGEES